MKNLIQILILSSILLSCDKGESELPECIETEINKFSSRGAICNESTVDQYTFQGKDVFLFNNEICCCDHGSSVIGSDCAGLGVFGTILGNTIINGEEFSNAVFIKNVWKK